MSSKELSACYLKLLFLPLVNNTCRPFTNKSNDASQSKIENDKINWVASPLIFQRNSRDVVSKITRGMVNYRAGSLNSQSTVLFNNASLWHVILCRTENKSKA